MSRALALLLVLVGCGGDTVMTTEAYDQTCELPNTCSAVFVGDVCGCPCEVDAINYTQQTLWAQERSRKQNRCDEVLTCQPCPEVLVDCVESTCTATLADEQE